VKLGQNITFSQSGKQEQLARVDACFMYVENTIAKTPLQIEVMFSSL